MNSNHSQSQTGRSRNTDVRKIRALEKAVQDIESLSPLFKNKKFKDLMDNVAFASKKTKAKVLENSFPEKIDQLTLELLDFASNIYDLYQSIHHDKASEADVVLCLAKTLNKQEEEVLVKQIKEKRGPDTVVRFEYNPDLVGGVQIYEEGSFTDYSIQSALRTLEKKLKK